jgi:hypothetical protein
MSKKPSKEQKEIGAVNMLRIYDTDLIERLNNRYAESGNRYEHKNHFLTDLIEAGLNRREYENALRDKLLENDAAMYKSADGLAARLTEFEKYTRTQFQSIHASDFLIKAMMSNLYFLSEAHNTGLKLPAESVRNGTYDELPERFQKLKETAERVFIKDE